MASAFWILEDGRGFARNCSAMASMLRVITDELKNIEEARELYHYLDNLVYREENGDIYNGFGGFIRKGRNIMFNFDLRSFTLQNRKFFWRATLQALSTLKLQDNKKNEKTIFFLTILLDMHRRIEHGEDPMELNHLRIIQPEPDEELGLTWN
ncbi:MAG: hypothetical protein MK212_12435 [Saprospiraceae bacterium]|nr:hypothetical protein [Saprospiraceae bacterium]